MTSLEWLKRALKRAVRMTLRIAGPGEPRSLAPTRAQWVRKASEARHRVLIPAHKVTGRRPLTMGSELSDSPRQRSFSRPLRSIE